jgi:dUTP pyrophosphatase
LYSVRILRDADGGITDVALESTDASVHIRKGDKIAQMSPFEARTTLPVVVVEELSTTERGGRGFGSTGR